MLLFEPMFCELSQALVTILDLAATFLDYARLAVPPEMDSRSLRPLLEGRTDQHRDHLLSGLQMREGDWRALPTTGATSWCAAAATRPCSGTSKRIPRRPRICPSTSPTR